MVNVCVLVNQLGKGVVNGECLGYLCTDMKGRV